MRKKVEKPGRGEQAAAPVDTRPVPAVAFTGTKRVLSTDEQAPSLGQSLRQPNERDESADQHRSPTRDIMKRAHDDVQSGQQDTDARNRVAEVLPDVPKTPQNFDRNEEGDKAGRVKKKTSA